MSNQRNIENGNILYLIILYLSENISSISSPPKKKEKKRKKEMNETNVQ